MQRQPAAAVGQLFVVDGDHAPLTGREILGGIKRKHRRPATRLGKTGVEGRTNLAIGVRAADGVRRILDDRQPVLGGETVDVRELAGLPAVVDGHDCPGARRDCGPCRCHIDIQIVADIDQYWLGAKLHDHVCGRAERRRRNDDLVAGADTQSVQRDVQTGGARIDGYRMCRFGVVGKVGLEPLHLRSHGDPAGAQGVDDFRNLLLADRRQRIRQE